MKKLLACLCVVTLLAGCGGSGNKSESKTCSITHNGMTLAATFNAKDDEIKTADMNVTVPASALGGVDLSTDVYKRQAGMYSSSSTLFIPSLL